MKFKVKKDLLTQGLDKVSGATGGRNSMQILGNVLIEASQGRIVLVTTDLELRIRTEIDADVAQEGKTTIPVKKFLTVVREISDEDIQIESGESGNILITYKNGHSKLYTIPADDFPAESEFIVKGPVELPQAELARMVSHVIYAGHRDDSRKILHGILLKFEQNIFTAVGTDGKRLAVSEKHVEKTEGSECDAPLILRSAMEIPKLLGKEGNVVIEFSENLVKMKMGRTIMTAKLTEGTYPNYKQVIPTSFSKKFEISVSELQAALRRVSLHISEGNPVVKLNVSKNTMDIFAASTDIGECEEKIVIDYSGSDIVVSFNPIYLMEPLKSVDADRIFFNMNDGFSPVMLSTEKEFLYVIMPIRSK